MFMCRRNYLLLQILVLAFVLALAFSAGCAVEGPAEEREAGDTEETAEEEAAEAGDGPFASLVDHKGREVVIPEKPERIVSISPSNTEVAFALDLGERIVAVTDYCNYPAEAENKPSIGGFSTPNVEEIVDREPDLVLAGSIHEEEVSKLEELGIPALVLSPETMEEIFESLRMVALATGSTAAYESLSREMRGRLAAVQEVVKHIEKRERVRVYYEVYSDPLMSVGSTAVIHEVISLAGGVNIFGDIDESYPSISAEMVVEREPQVILFPDYHGTAEFMVEQLQERSGWESIPALANDRVYAASDDAFARPGPRVVEAVEEAARIFYPALF